MEADPWADPPAQASTTAGAVSTSIPTDNGSASYEQDFPTSPNVEPEEDREEVEQPQEADAKEDEVRDEAEEEATDRPDPYAATSSETPATGEDDDFDDFDDFDQPAAGTSSPRATVPASGGQVEDDDGFGDFDDFEQGEFEAPEEPGVQAVPPEVIQPQWSAARLTPMPNPSELVNQLTLILTPVYDPNNQPTLSEEPPKQSGGIGQVMVSESSRQAYAQLITAPMLKPLDWTRSKVRRDHLISMGVPVNLDEIDSHRLSSLPPLRITTSSASMPPPSDPRRSSADVNGRYSAQQKGKGRDMSPAGNGSHSVPASAGGIGMGSSTVGTGGVKGAGKEKYGLGRKPDFDQERAEDLCGVEEDQLSMLSLDKLRAMQAEIVDTSAQASALLAWSLQLKDAQTQDSATYNGMISELISNAAKAKSAQTAGSGGVFKRASIKGRPQSLSGTTTPRRAASPAMR